mgnify:CR=1 FL=1
MSSIPNRCYDAIYNRKMEQISHTTNSFIMENFYLTLQSLCSFQINNNSREYELNQILQFKLWQTHPIDITQNNT